MGAQSRLTRDRKRINQSRHAVPAVCLAYIHPGNVSSYFAESLLTTTLADRAGNRSWRISNILQEWSSANVSAARNTVTQRFLDSPEYGDWLLWIDADMQWEPDAIDLLVASADSVERPIVGGLAFGNAPEGLFPTIYHWLKLPDGGISTVRVRDYPRDQLIQVAATGAAFLLIHRTALERMSAHGFDRAFPFFAESSGNGKPVGEDITFCVRAGILGLPVHVHTGARIGHHKSILLTEEEFLRQLPAGLPPSVGVVIPTKGDHPDLLAGIVAASGLPPERVVIVANGGARVDPSIPATWVADDGPLNIHRWWNTGIDLLAERGCTRVAVLNDDLIISPDTLPRLWRGMGSATLALATDEGPSGHLFMLDLGHGVRPDEAYAWYCGDLQLIADASAARGVVRVPEAWHVHLHATEATESSAELVTLAAADDALYDERNPVGSPFAAVRNVK